jgi:hypothetical protein
MIHYIWYGKISLEYKLCIIDDFLLCYFDALYRGSIIEKTGGSTMVGFVADLWWVIIYWEFFYYKRSYWYDITNKNAPRSNSLVNLCQNGMQAGRAKPACYAFVNACSTVPLNNPPWTAVVYPTRREWNHDEEHRRGSL